MSAFKIEKIANAFIANAVPSQFIGGAVLKELNRLHKKHGGLWIGGKVTATPEGLRFTPNGMNIAFHDGLESTYIPWDSIHAVAREFGWVTGIVVVRHAQGEFRFRCFGAKRIAAILNFHVTAPKTH